MTDKENFLNIYNDIQNKLSNSNNVLNDQKDLFAFLTSDKTENEWKKLAKKRAENDIVETKEIIKDGFILGAVLLKDYSLENKIDNNYEMKMIKTPFYISWLFLGLENKILHNIFAIRELNLKNAKENYNTLLDIINTKNIAEILDEINKNITTL